MNKLIVAITISTMFTLFGCVYVVDQNLVESLRGNKSTISIADNCSADLPMKYIVSKLEHVEALNSNGFSMLSWNIKKGMRAGWEKDFRRLSYNKDLLIIQEAYLTDQMRELLHNGHFKWDLSVAFEYRGLKAGVLTASKIEPGFVCTTRHTEPVIRIPKTVLITGYPLSGGQLLMVANVHLINYTLTTLHFSAQLAQLERILSNHDGPLIISGDFNTWSNERMTVVEEIAGRLGLKTAMFSQDNRVEVFGRHVDHIYYRELEIIETFSPTVTTSDHNPLVARFRLANAP